MPFFDTLYPFRPLPGDDTGPPFPLPPSAGANAAGVGQWTGFNPDGDIPLLAWWDVVISQYGNSPILTSVISSHFSAVDLTASFDSFYDNVWNVDTATGYGLDVWGRIVGVNRVLTVENEPIFGFAEASTTAVGWGQGRFYRSGVTSNFSLIDQDFRRLILAKALSNISDATIPSINRILLALFPNRGNVWVDDGGAAPTFFGFEEGDGTGEGWNQAPFLYPAGFGMRMSYVFAFPISAIDLAIMSSGVLPKPSGVAASIRFT